MAKQVTLVGKDECENLIHRLKIIETRVEHDEIATALSEINELILLVEERLD